MCWSSTASRVDHDKYWKQTLGFQEEISEPGVICTTFFLIGMQALEILCNIFFWSALQNQASTLLHEVTITYFHSPIALFNPNPKFLSCTNLWHSCIFEKFARENLYNGCPPMDHEKHLVTLSVKNKRNS